MAEYEVVTKDNEVEDINQVQVKLKKVVSDDRILTLSYLNTQIQVVTTEIQNAQAKLAELNALVVDVDKEAKKVKLKVKPEPIL